MVGIGKILSVLIGLAVGCTGCYLLLKDVNLIRQCTVEVTGVVKSVDVEEGDEGKNEYRTTVGYSAEGVEYVNRTYGVSVNSPAYSVGESVTLFHDPSDPNRFYLPGERKLSILLSLCAIAFSVVFPYLFCRFT